MKLFMVAMILATATTATSANANGTIVNIDATHGFTFDSGGSDPAPVPGQHINPIGTSVTLTLGAGTHTITNGYSNNAGGLFDAWSYNVGSNSWAWAFVLADASDNKVINYYGVAGGNSEAEVAAMSAVQNFSTTFTLASSTTLLFTLRDYYTGDNAGGISLNVDADAAQPITGAVPEPATWAMMIGGFGAVGCAMRYRRRKADLSIAWPITQSVPQSAR